MSAREGSYPTEERVTLAEAPGLRVRRLSLGRGQCVPWHYHNHITDTFFCEEGVVCVRTRGPDAEHVLRPGGTCAVAPPTPHFVSGRDGEPCRFIIVQGVGEYDYVALDDEDR